jgi:hypothetical protein
VSDGLLFLTHGSDSYVLSVLQRNEAIGHDSTHEKALFFERDALNQIRAGKTSKWFAGRKCPHLSGVAIDGNHEYRLLHMPVHFVYTHKGRSQVSY